MVGTIVGTYRLEALLGDGGLGGVYRAVDQTSGREAAFRVFARDVSADAMLADRLRAMAPALKKLQHPNIASFFELVSLGADLAFFLEFVPGVPLDRVRQPAGRLDTSVAVSCAVQVLRALEAAHGAGVLHHALRPTNVMVTRQGTVKVLDFGIGHAFGANRKTREDRLLTVLAYLAPEQIQNQPGDARADFYSVGVLLYELLTGTLPFAHRTEFALRQAHLSEPPVPPRTIVPGLPEWLDQAVLRALAKNPASRYQNATEFRAVLEAALGLSTSREAAIVRQRDGAYEETFAAAPPIPPPPPKVAAVAAPAAPGERATTQAAVAGPPAGGGVVGAAPLPAAASPAPVAAPSRPAARARALAASVVAVLGFAAAGSYFLTRGPSSPVPAVETEVPGDDAAVEAPSAALTGPPAVEAPPAPGMAAAPPAASQQRVARSPQAKPVAGSKPAAVVSPPARLPAPAPPDATSAPPPAAPEPSKVEKAPDVSYRKVKFVTQVDSSERSTDVVLMLSDDRLSVTPAGGGAALRTLRYAEITAASYSKAQKRRLGFIRSSRHLLELETSGETLLLRLDKDNFEPILAAIEARTGQAVSR
ncbi:MAG: serine/threonine-protein kinase [Vicinamibacterales bacterium]